jgi:replication-associated recombination protein RarA
MSTQLSDKLRPKRLADVFGQDAAVSYIRGMMKKGDAPNCMMITGPTGTGKTTLAYIIGNLLSRFKGDPETNPDIRDIPANVERSIDDVRAAIEFSKYAPRGGHRRIMIVDEVQGLVGPAKSALLKATEKPPKHVTWICCTNEPWKLDKTLIDRGQSLALKLVCEADLIELLQAAVVEEKMNLGKHQAVILQKIAEMSHGTPRGAVQLLETVNTTMIGGAGAREALDLAVNSNPASENFECAKQFLQALLEGSSADAIKAIGGNDGGGVLEVVSGMLTQGLVRQAAGTKPSTGLGWMAIKSIRVGAKDLPMLLDLQARMVAAMDIRSRYAVPADALLFGIARKV